MSGELRIWEEPRANEIYDIGADCAPPETGENPDYSGFSVIKRSNQEQVAEWRGRPNGHDFATILFCIGRYYNNAYLWTCGVLVDREMDTKKPEQPTAATCLHCGYNWMPRTTQPRNCPRCKSPRWDKPVVKRFKEK